MAHLAQRSGYDQLVQRLNRFPQGAPAGALLYNILKYLFSEQEARLVSRLPLRVFTLQKAARAWGFDEAKTRAILNRLSRRALLVDFELNGQISYCLPPPMAGFLEFSFMRTRGDIDQKVLAELLYRYINVEEDFAKALFTQGETQLGRVFVLESQIPPLPILEVLDYERASHVIETATHIGVGLCYCRHKMTHINRACKAPMDICLTFNLAAACLIRHDHARSIGASEAMDVMQRARAHFLVQFGENVREDVSFICNCCKCCCEGMIAARRFSMFHPVHTTNFLPHIDTESCNGCSRCTQVCPVDAITMREIRGEKKKSTLLYEDICLGCGVCAQACPTKAVTMQSRTKRVITPLNTAHRTVLMAIERGTLQHILLDNQVMRHYRTLATFLGTLMKLPPIKQVLASKQLKSRYLEAIIKRLGWQPINIKISEPNQSNQERSAACSILP